MTLYEYLKPLNHAQQCELARQLGTSWAGLRQYARGGRRMSADRAIELERLSGGAVPCETIRPETNWAYIRGSTRPKCKHTSTAA